MMILDELGYDVRTIGNHEFDKKMVGLGDMFALSKVPVVASNYDFSNTGLSQYVLPSTMIETRGLKIGFIGLNVRLLNLVDPTACEGVVWQDAINVADKEALKLREQGADMVIALSHLGYQKNDDRVYYDRGIAMNTRHIDMIIGGHSHTFLNWAEYITNLDGDRVPIVQTGSRGVCLGYAKIRLGEDGVPSFDYRLIPVDSRLDSRVDKEFSDMIDAYSATVVEKMNEVLGYCPYAIRKGSPESPLGNLTADGLIWMAKEYFNVDADVSIYNSGGIRAEISKGNLTLGDVYAVYPFDNVLTILTMKGKDLRTLFDDVAADGGLPINKAVKLVISNRKVKSVTINGKPIDDNKTYTVSTIDYVVNTKRYGLEKALTRNDSYEIIRDYFGAYLRYLASQNGSRQITYSVDGRIVVE
jgi:2',3'-cyclic-nucleotide 2'-phosphodiesterase (5'-nucleotidase family)